ncbi:MAG: hypothetical protein AMXMBFR84_08600 [Candidatus Hydrogenedentota bacterium]
MSDAGRYSPPLNMGDVRLKPPPRLIPVSLRLHLIFGNGWSLLGWLVLGFGSIFFWSMAVNSDLTSWYVFRGELERREAQLIESWETGVSIGEEPVTGHRYTFSLSDGHSIEDTSYHTGEAISVPQIVEIEYPQGKPEHSRITGMRSAVMPLAGIFTSIPAIVGLVFACIGFRKGRYNARLLEVGEMARGKLLTKEPTNVRVNDQTVYKLTFSFTASDRRAYTASAKTHNTALLESEEGEWIVYDPYFPEQAVLIDSLPGTPGIGADGLFQGKSKAAVILVLFVPVLVGAGTIVCLAHVLQP